jgi:Glycosyl transferase family 2
MRDGGPLLSICIPTFNRAELLRVMLQALLPQVAQVTEDVEVWVLDNASSDHTAGVVKEAKLFGPVQYLRNSINVGPAANVIKGPTELAQGRFVWILGDHNLMARGALKRLLTTLSDNAHLDVFYVNFQCANCPDQWPASAVGGYDGPHAYLANQKTGDRAVERWSDLITGGSALCTQAYAHIVATDVWRNYWRGRYVPESFSSPISTYPHTWMIAQTLFSAPARYVGFPALTIFNGAQSWSQSHVRAKVYLAGLPGLLDLYAEKGLSPNQVLDAKQFVTAQVEAYSRNEFRTLSTFHALTRMRYAGRRSFKRSYVLRGLFRGFMNAQSSWISRSLRRAAEVTSRVRIYLFQACRPARWMRSRLQNAGKT